MCRRAVSPRSLHQSVRTRSTRNPGSTPPPRTRRAKPNSRSPAAAVRTSNASWSPCRAASTRSRCTAPSVRRGLKALSTLHDGHGRATVQESPRTGRAEHAGRERLGRRANERMGRALCPGWLAGRTIQRMDAASGVAWLLGRAIRRTSPAPIAGWLVGRANHRRRRGRVAACPTSRPRLHSTRSRRRALRTTWCAPRVPAAPRRVPSCRASRWVRCCGPSSSGAATTTTSSCSCPPAAGSTGRACEPISVFAG